MISLTSPLQFVDCRNPLLEGKAQALSKEMVHSPEMQTLFDAILSFAIGEQSDQQKHALVGLAAPQIGLPFRIILVDIQADGKGRVSYPRLYVNPEIIDLSQEKEKWYEGCFSTGCVKGIVERSSNIRIRALNRDAQEIEEMHSGYVARIFQHEIDHLNGIRFPDRIPPEECVHLVNPAEMYFYRNEEGWRNWNKVAPQEEWKNHM